MLYAIKSEIESAQIYNELAEKFSSNYLLSERLKFLAKEEDLHQTIITRLFKDRYPDRPIELPKDSIVPIPKIKIEKVAEISDLFHQAMNAELVAHEFYKDMAERFDEESKKVILRYLSDMEMGHYYILKSEYELSKNEEIYHDYNELMHAGP